MSNRPSVFLAGLFAAAMPLASIGGQRPAKAAALAAVRQALPHPLSAADKTVLAASNAFSFALWREINHASVGTNVFVSPLSASLPLVMALNGAANATLSEMRSGLQFGDARLSTIDSGYKSLIGLVTSLDPTVTISIANSIWYRRAFPVDASFLKSGTAYFGATITPLNFADQAGSLAAINGWVNTQTGGKISSILTRIDTLDRMFLISAIYFNGSWRTRFDPLQTVDAPFHADGGDQPARLMHRGGTMRYADAPTYQMVDLPYGNASFTMTILLPKAGTSVETLAASLDAPVWQSIVAARDVDDVDLFLPKVKLEWGRELIADLVRLGIRAPFDKDRADFAAMLPPGKRLFVSRVRQKTFVDVNEEGTEAAAVTAMTVTRPTAAHAILVMRVDRPFILVIRERLTETVLFLGKVVRLN